MDQGHSHTPPTQKSHRRRRMALLAALAAVGLGTGLTASTVYQGNAAPASPAPASPKAPSVKTAEIGRLGFADLVAKVRPAVISVRVKLDEGPTLSSNTEGENGLPFPPGSPMDKFFQQFGFPGMPQGRSRSHTIVTGEGSGFFISADGYAVTNNHVVDHATSVQVTTDDGKTYSAKVVGTDKKTDLALIKVEGHHKFPFVTFADKSPRVGDWTVVIGNPFGLSETVTAGIVSAERRNIGTDPYDSFMQIDAPINRGNSGGPCVNLKGQVVGVTTAIYSVSGGSVGIGFAIPASTARSVVAQLKSSGHVTRGWLGTEIQEVTPSIADSLGMKEPEGALVAQVEAGSPAMKAHLKAGDVILSVNGKQVKGSLDLVRKIGALAPGADVNLGILRDGSHQTLTVTLGHAPGKQQVAGLGLSLAPAGSVAGAGSRGVVVTGVKPESAAAKEGLQTGDVILEVGGKAVSTPAEVRNDIASYRASGKRRVLIRMQSGDHTRFVALPVGNA
jgi:serine protease Do